MKVCNLGGLGCFTYILRNGTNALKEVCREKPCEYCDYRAAKTFVWNNKNCEIILGLHIGLIQEEEEL